MATTETPVEPTESIVARLRALPSGERRAAFFGELKALPLHSYERLDLANCRRLFPECSGPFPPEEWNILSGILWPSRVIPPAEQSRLDTHAEACKVLQDRRDALEAARLDEHRERQAQRLRERRREDPTPEQAVALTEAVARLIEAQEAYIEAQSWEVRARPHQPDRRSGAARNWLRTLLVRK